MPSFNRVDVISSIKGVQVSSREKPQARAVDLHPDEYQQDLNPNAMAGQNIGAADMQLSRDARTAFDLKGAHARLDELSDDDLKQILIIPEGARLEQGATYLDLKELDRGEFTATGDMQAVRDHWYV